MLARIYELNRRYDCLLETNHDRAFLWFILPLAVAAVIGIIGQLAGYPLFFMALPVAMMLAFGFRLPYRLRWIEPRN